MPSWHVHEELYCLAFYNQTKGIWFKSLRNVKRKFLNPHKIRDLKYAYTKRALMVRNGKLMEIHPFWDVLSLAISNAKTWNITFQILRILWSTTMYTMWKCKRNIILSIIISYCINFLYFKNIFEPHCTILLLRTGKQDLGYFYN
jgi:hypothetical protein